MNIKADRDSKEYSLVRKGTYRLGSTSGQIPLKIRRLTANSNCEARTLKDDEQIHINEWFKQLTEAGFSAMTSGKTGVAQDYMSRLDDFILEDLESESNLNVVRYTIPDGKKYTKNNAEELVKILYGTKKNRLILAPLNSDRTTLGTRRFLIMALKNHAESEPKKDVIGHLPAQAEFPCIETLIYEYLKIGIKVFALDVNGGNIPAGWLGKINAILDKALNGDYLLLVIGLPETPRDTSQTVMANDVSWLPRGYDGYAPNRIGSGPKKKKIDDDKRYKKIRPIDEKGKRRLFVQDNWGRTQIAGIITDEPDILGSNQESIYCTKTSKIRNIEDLFFDDECDVDTFKAVLRCHDTELVEKELIVIGEAAIEGQIEDRISQKAYGKNGKGLVEEDRKEFDSFSKKNIKQVMLD